MAVLRLRDMAPTKVKAGTWSELHNESKCVVGDSRIGCYVGSGSVIDGVGIAGTDDKLIPQVRPSTIAIAESPTCGDIDYRTGPKTDYVLQHVTLLS